MTARRFPEHAPTLDTERLVLSALSHDDAAPLVPAINHPEIARNTQTIPHPYTLDDARRFLERVEHDARHDAGVVWKATEGASDGSIVACIGARLSENDPDPELGYWVAHHAWGRGYATEALDAVVRFLFARTPFPRLHACFFLDNPASGRVLEKAGFTPDGDELCDRALASCRSPARRMRLSREHFGQSAP